ncbi:MAG: hypothetical protein ABIN36_06480 [Ferruginibacter sp.]
MSHYVFCITIDIDPDGLSGKDTNRNASSFKSFEALDSFSPIINEELKMEIPVTWFIRIDDQVKFFFGNRFYLFEEYKSFWERSLKTNHELAWHPHVYEQKGNEFVIPTSIDFCIDQISSLHNEIQTYSLDLRSFRNGEGWHTNETIQLIGRLGFAVDSTALPGMKRSGSHRMNWEQAVNSPYFPSRENYQLPGEDAGLLEMPMNTWWVRAPYDEQPKRRYMNPAIHSKIFAETLEANPLTASQGNLNIITLISHPDEIVGQPAPDNLYGRTIENFIVNIRLLIDEVTKQNGSFEFLTMQQAAIKWREFNHSIQ